ncbi:hypothetical protein TNCV_3233091 [Trichonephila clavipes]|nr:hypothetical protein TNCV_3233091 [Trichonephila clavipes]
MDVCKCTVPSRLGGTLNILRAASPLMRLVETTFSKKSIQIMFNKHYFMARSWGHETTTLRVKGDIEDVSSELDNGG